MSRYLNATTTVAALAMMSSAAFAQGTAAQRAACTPDVLKLCRGDIPNVGKIVACLRREKANLSTGCQQVFGAMDSQPSTVATRSLSGTPTDGANWCAFGAAPLPGQDVWIAWCDEMKRVD